MITLEKLTEAIELMPDHVREVLTSIYSYMSIYPHCGFTAHWMTLLDDIEAGLEHYHAEMAAIPEAEEVEAKTGAYLEDE